MRARLTVAGKRSTDIPPRGTRTGVNSPAINTSVGKLEILVQLFVHYTQPPTYGFALGTLFTTEATSSLWPTIQCSRIQGLQIHSLTWFVMHLFVLAIYVTNGPLSVRKIGRGYASREEKEICSYFV